MFFILLFLNFVILSIKNYRRVNYEKSNHINSSDAYAN
jgi:hypothetical protein